MAEKKFFVDINLQGNALTNATIGTNSSLTKAGSFGFDGTRLKYFDGSAIKEVANLTDIAAVTGGLILQGGYDAVTNTPDIAADSSVLKGFFWVVTAAGSFLGEAVQVGDSIIAKQDNPGATAANWLILQGNVVIATDSVDGISRLATQTEANDGTEGGAVVITPATLQGKIDAQVTPEINNKLPLAGGTMSGNINMNNNSLIDISFAYINNAVITNLKGNGGPISLENNIDALDGQTVINLPAPTNGGDAANKTYVDDQDALKVSKSGDTMSGNLNMGYNQLLNVANIHVDAIVSQSGGAIDLASSLNADSNAITNLPAPTNGGDAANKTYVDTKLPLAGGTMSGTIDMDENHISNAGSLSTTPNANVYFNDSRVQGVSTPTVGSDAANKTYVDNAASTAESNANDYTDTAIATEVTDRNNAIKATSFTASIEGSSGTSGWTFDAILGAYKAEITHNLGMLVTVSTFYDTYPTEFAGEYTNNVYYIYSNTEPVETTVVNFVKAGGNL